MREDVAMISNLSEGDWQEINLEDALQMVTSGLAYECNHCEDYGDDMRSFHFTQA